MPPRAKSFLMVAVLVLSAGLWAQETGQASHSALLARLAYDSSVNSKDGGVRHICLAVSRDGTYRMLRTPDAGPMERLEGSIPQQQFVSLKKLLRAPDFRTVSGTHSGLIRQEAETFAAEIARGEGSPQRLQWLNPDGESPFPNSVTKVVNWLTRFEPSDGRPFVYSEHPDVCPPGRMRLLQPSMAKNGAN